MFNTFHLASTTSHRLHSMYQKFKTVSAFHRSNEVDLVLFLGACVLISKRLVQSKSLSRHWSSKYVISSYSQPLCYFIKWFNIVNQEIHALEKITRHAVLRTLEVLKKKIAYCISLPSSSQGLILQCLSPFISRTEGLRTYHRMKNLCRKLHEGSITNMSKSSYFWKTTVLQNC